MKLVYALPLIALSSLAYADTPKAKAPVPTPAPKPITVTKKTKLGTATVTITADDMTKVAMVIDDGSAKITPPAIEEPSANCGAGSCRYLTVKAPQIRELKFGSNDLVIVDIDERFEHSTNEGPKSTPVEKWTVKAYVVCSKAKCQTFTYGSRDQKCTAKLTKNGIEHTCTETQSLSL